MIKKNYCYVFIFLFVVLNGCAAAPVVVSSGAGAVKRYSSGVVKKTFTASFNDTRTAGVYALKRMGFEPLQEKENKENVYAFAKDLTISIFLKPLTDKASFVKVAARRDNVFLSDSATGLEVIAQMEKFLSEK